MSIVAASAVVTDCLYSALLIRKAMANFWMKSCLVTNTSLRTEWPHFYLLCCSYHYCSCCQCQYSFQQPFRDMWVYKEGCQTRMCTTPWCVVMHVMRSIKKICQGYHLVINFIDIYFSTRFKCCWSSLYIIWQYYTYHLCFLITFFLVPIKVWVDLGPQVNFIHKILHHYLIHDQVVKRGRHLLLIPPSS